MLLAALVLSLPATVDYTTVAKPLPVVLRELSEVVGETWRSANSLDSELLVVRVEDVSVEELRKRIADAVVGKWWFESDAWVLKPDSATLRKRGEGLRKSYANQLAKAAAEHYNDVVAEPLTPSEAELWKAAEEGETADVASVVLAHALPHLDYYEIAGLPEGVTQVSTAQPTIGVSDRFEA